MAVTVVWDLIEGADVSMDTSTLEITRSGMATGISNSATADPYATINAVVAALAASPGVAPGTVGTWISRLLIKPLDATDRVKLLVTYKGPSPKPKTGVMWLVEDDSTVAQEREEVDWKTGVALGVSYQGDLTVNPNSNMGQNGPSQIQPPPLFYPTPCTPMRPRRIIKISGYTFGLINANVLNCFDCVNASPWPSTSLFQGDSSLGPGFWLCTNSSAELQGKGLYGMNPVNPKQMMFKAAVSFTTKASQTFKRDWSEYKIYKDIKGFVPPNMVTAAAAARVKALIQSPYKEGADNSVNGFLRYGGYPMFDWTGVFGL